MESWTSRCTRVCRNWRVGWESHQWTRMWGSRVVLLVGVYWHGFGWWRVSALGLWPLSRPFHSKVGNCKAQEAHVIWSAWLDRGSVIRLYLNSESFLLSKPGWLWLADLKGHPITKGKIRSILAGFLGIVGLCRFFPGWKIAIGLDRTRFFSFRGFEGFFADLGATRR